MKIVIVRCRCHGRADWYRDPVTGQWRVYCTTCYHETSRSYVRVKDARAAWTKLVRSRIKLISEKLA